MLLEQLASNPSFIKLDFPMLLPSEEEKAVRLNGIVSDINLSSRLNQIAIVGFQKKSPQPMDNSLIEYQLMCSCLGFKFECIFHSKRQTSGRQKIILLKISCKSLTDKNFEAWILKCENSCDLVGFFRTLPSYLSRLKEKAECLNLLKEKLPNYIKESLPAGICVLSSPRSSLFQLTLVYSVNPSSSGNQVEASVELIPSQISKKLTGQQASIINEVSQNFKSLCDLHGPFEALNAIIKVIWE
ncbi:hypothetical protein DSO57_1029672 [Entomophthora muscae]|uniref:Uncharacterized protein n=1 Tax=Entomophthora muscae TaxID=34485 RepID=A0ACC2SQ38_9FUNG|nr:hypothetical protein DSO57_1029672 [Entomophthora muscae]